jgi:sodium/potassium-transporting ATPase subunit alpha
MKNPLEATNLAFNGTLCVNGEGFGIVIRTGDNTVLGQIAGLTAGETKRESPLAQEISEFVKTISGIATVTTLIFFILGLTIKDKSLAYNINFAVGVFVSWVPEGLPATITVSLLYLLEIRQCNS